MPATTNPLPTPATAELRKLSLSPTRRRLVALVQKLAFGSIHNLPVVAGEPVMAPPPRVVRRRKNGGQNSPRPQVDATDFTLKREWVDLFHDLDSMGNGTILLIEVAHGLPIIHEYEDLIPV